jgi:prevent-host-death family protein
VNKVVTLTASAAKEKFLSLIRESHDFGSSYTITHNGKPYAVLLSTDEYEGLLETLEILKDRNATEQLLTAVKAADEGNTLSFEDVTGRKQKK